MNEKKKEPLISSPETSLAVQETVPVRFEDIGSIKFDGLSKLKTSVFGGYDKESVLNNIEQIIGQSEDQLSSLKQYAKAIEENNAALERRNATLQEELYRLMTQVKEDQADLAARMGLKEEQIALLQRENQQLKEKIGRDKQVLLARTQRQLETLQEVRQPNIEPAPAPTTPVQETRQAVRSETKLLIDQVTEFLNSEVSGERSTPKLSGGDENWDLDLILKEYGD